MANLGKIARRGFLIGSAAIAGGVVFGTWAYRKPHPNPLSPGAGEVTLNPYVLVTAGGVSIVTPRAEMGQGAQTTLAALVAEEMDLNWTQVRVLHGPAAKAYFNGAVAAAGLPFTEYEESRAKHIAEAAVGVVGKFAAVQVTGGSTSIRDGFVKMRKAGAAARAVLMQAAAQRLSVDVRDLTTEGGAVLAPDGTRLPYTALAEAAAEIRPPANPPLKDPSSWRLLGQSLPRLDIPAKVTGTAEFGIDKQLGGMLHAAVRMNPHLGAGAAAIDATAAEAMPGVEQIVALPGGVAVLARTTWHAMQALDAVQVAWEDAPYPPDTDSIFARIAEAFGGRPGATLRKDGDVGAALADGALTAEYRLPYLAHATMEPMNATALFDDGRLIIWTGNQAPTVLRDKAAKIAGLNADQVDIETPFMGGGFGRRAETDASDIAARLALAVPGRPVKLTYSREEDMRHDFYRPGVIARMAGRVGPEGPLALSADIAGASVYKTQTARVTGFAPPGPDKILVEGLFDAPYGIPDFRVRGYIADVAVPVGSWRSVGHSHNCFVMESFLDELAAEADLDPVAMRLRLMRGESAKAAAVLEAVAEMAGWTGKTPDGVGRGVAFSYSFGSPTAEIVELRQEEAGIRIAKVWCAQDVGLALDPRNIEAQIISGIAYGLSAAIGEEVTFEDGAVVEGNFDSYEVLRIDRMPEIESRILASGGAPGGVGEPATPPIAPALANAIFDLTGQRIRRLPLRHAVEFA